MMQRRRLEIMSLCAQRQPRMPPPTHHIISNLKPTSSSTRTAATRSVSVITVIIAGRVSIHSSSTAPTTMMLMVGATHESRAQALQGLMGRRTCEGEVPPETCTVEEVALAERHTSTHSSKALSGCFCMMFPMDDVDDARDIENMLRLGGETAWDSGSRAPVTVALQFGRERVVSRVRLQAASTTPMARHELWLNRAPTPSTTTTAAAATATLVGVYEGPVKAKEWIEIDLLQLRYQFASTTPNTTKAATPTTTTTANHKHALMEQLAANGVTVRTTAFAGNENVAWYALRVDELRVHPSFSSSSGGYGDTCPCCTQCTATTATTTTTAAA